MPLASCGARERLAVVLLPALHGRFGDHRDAVRVGDEVSSWEALAARAAAVGDRITGMPTVALCATPSMETIVAVVAALGAGTPVVPLAADAGPLERAHVLHDCGAAAVLGDPDWPDVALPRVSLDAGTVGPVTRHEAEQGAALVMYTSGTTGLPKGAVLSGRAVAADLDGLADAWDWTSEDTLVHGLPLFHVHGLVLGVLGALRAGAKLVHTVRPTAAAYAAANGTLYFGVPTVWSRICNDPAAAGALAGARLLVSGSAPLPVPVFDQIVALTGHRPIERYGMTETLITVSTRADGDRRPGVVGRPIAGVETRLLGERGEPVPHDGESVGELQVRGSTLFDGYLGRADQTAASFVDGWFVTGDAATIAADGVHRIVGRMSIDIIKSGGFKVGAGEVEAALLAHPNVSEAAVVGSPDDDLEQRIVAFVVGDGVDAASVASFVSARLTSHKRPREIRVVDSLPRNAMGKVLKTKLLE